MYVTYTKYEFAYENCIIRFKIYFLWAYYYCQASHTYLIRYLPMNHIAIIWARMNMCVRNVHSQLHTFTDIEYGRTFHSLDSHTKKTGGQSSRPAYLISNTGHFCQKSAKTSSPFLLFWHINEVHLQIVCKYNPNVN